MIRSRGELTIRRSAIAHNWRTLAQQAPSTQCAAVVKANAYGVGVEPVAQSLWAEGCRTYYVASLEEGVALRTDLPDAEICLFDGYPPEWADPVEQLALRPVLNRPDEVLRYRQRYPGGGIWQIDTGMNRLGLSLTEAAELMEAGSAPDRVLMHLAVAEEPQHAVTRTQLAAAARWRERWPAIPLSLGNTAGCQLGSGAASDECRVGIGLFGLNPGVGSPPLQPALRLRGRILQQRRVARGETVSYGATWRAPRDTTLATVGLGYADGLPRGLGNRARLTLAGHPADVVGVVTMDYLMVDAGPTGVPESEEWVTVFEQAGELEALARVVDTIPYELLTRLGPRIERRHVD
ncbi:MAG: alanine racemase [Pseudomonadota bacterium]